MCASVCPSGALYYGTDEEIEYLRPRSRTMNRFQFGRQTITTRVHMMVPRDALEDTLDVTAAMHQEPLGRDLLESVFAGGSEDEQ